ncbi:hypothetical protein TCE0_034r11431 [Talaromyces pinophilus]|uniref:Uncharacterized protein n=1 Tax=Talaromyces pinophilus TaxID=128442 RepID=A0A6V8HEY9_TALPI|nr:hypothetical protein TCE0_034r11431 [Talaromyces pinophilus]
MPLTRSQMQAQEGVSPLRSLETPRRVRRTTTAAPSKKSADTKKATNTKAKRGPKPTKKATVVATEETDQENIQNKSEILTQETQPIQTPTQETPGTPGIPQIQGQVPVIQTPPSINAAQDNGSTISPAPATPQPDHDDSDASSVSSLGSMSSLGSPAKKTSVRNALKFFKDSLKESLKGSSLGIRHTYHKLKKGREPRDNPFERGVPALPTDVKDWATYETNYSLAEDEILDAALKIVLQRQATDSSAFDPASIRCPCCEGVVKMECVQGHDMRSWMSKETIMGLNGVLTNMCAEGILVTAEAKENLHRAAKEAEAAAKAKAAQLAKQQKEELSARQKGKKRALESNNDENITDGPPRAQRRRTRPPPGKTPRSKRRTPTTNPGRSLSYLETVRQRASAQSSVFQFDEAMSNLREQEQAEQAAREAADEEARNDITRRAMERHMILGPIPEDMQSSFQLPVYEDEDDMEDDEDNEDENRPVETPTSNNWGLRSLLTSVTGSVRRRLAPFMRQAPDQAVPFAAGGGATPARVDGAAAPTTETNATQITDMDLTYSLYPRIPSPPRITPSSEGKAKADEQKDESNKTTETAKENVQVPGTEQTEQNETNGELQNADTQAEPSTGSHKRKRAPSPDVIPNPAGCSYGMDLDYFTYSDDEIEEAEEYSRRELEREAAAAKSTVSAPTARPPEKRARFLPPEAEAESSNVRLPITNTATQTHWQPPTPPGWNRPTTTVYQGQMFQGMRHQTPSFHFDPYQSTPDLRTQPTPLVNPYTQPMQQMQPMQPPSKTFPQSGLISDLRKAATERRRLNRENLKNNIVNNDSGTPANRFLQSHVSQPAPQPVAQPSPVRTPAQQPILQTRVESPAQQIVQQPLQPPSVQAQQVVQQPLQQQSAQAPVEQKMQQVSQQQLATGASINGVSSNQPTDRSITAAAKQNISDETTRLPPIKPLSATARGQPVTERSRPKTPSRLRNNVPLSSSPASQASPAQTLTGMHPQDPEDLMQVFGDDEYGREAFELYQRCPSGDFSKVQWPSFDPLPVNNIQETTRFTPVSAGQQRASHNSFQKSFKQFQNELDQGLIDTDEILGDLIS